jgi:alpha-L-rhamnosidase
MKNTFGTLLVCMLVVAAAACPVSFGESSGIGAGGLGCEYRVNPLGVDETAPRLSWVLQSNERGQKQSSYRILVASSENMLKADKGDLWDSDRIDSSKSVGVVYRGKALRSAQRCYWKVRVWDKDGRASKWSRTAWWEMGLLDEKDWGGKWISDGEEVPGDDEAFYEDDPAPLFRKEFTTGKTVKRARLYISGIGYYEAYLNGQKVGDHVLDSLWTNYSRRVLYSGYDVTELLKAGGNCIGVTLGNGWYNPLPLRMWGHRNIRKSLPVGRPCFIAQLNVEYSDGSSESIVSDKGWKVADGPIVRNSIYLGELYDARLEMDGWNKAGVDDSGWSQASIADGPSGKLQWQFCEPIKVTGRIKPVKVTEPKAGLYIFDMGQNFGGWARLMIRAERGNRIKLRYGELLGKDGTLNPMTSVAGQIKGKRKDKQGNEVSVGGPGAPPIAWQQDVYIAKGGGLEIYTPRFTFHAFRYVEVAGLKNKPTLDSIEGLRLHCNVKPVGEFSCSNEMFNRIQEISRRTFLSNIFGVQSDCPHRERFGYGGDLVNTSDAFMLNYNMSGFYAKAVYDWADAARDNGMLTDTAPFVGIQYCGLAWAMAHPHLQLQLYRYYGDRRILEKQYDVSRKWFELVIKQTPDHIVKKGLSDHEALERAPAPVMVTPLYRETARIMSQMARILGRNADEKRYSELASQIKSAYADKFIDGETGKVGPGSQASQAFALSLGMIDDGDTGEKAFQCLLNDIKNEHDGHLSTGIFGTRLMLDLLSARGHAPVAYGIVNQRSFPGWGYMLDNGATTLWEHWALSENTFSHNHPMFGSVSQWFFHRLGGIRPHPESIGFDRIIIRPEIVDDLEWVKCRYDSVRGPISSKWQKRNGRLHLDIEIPVNSRAEVFIPVERGKKILEAGKPLESIGGIMFLRKENGTMAYQVGSGRYSFTVE